MEPTRVQQPLDGVEWFALREQCQREATCATTREIDGTRLLGGPLGVPRLQCGRQAADVAAVHGREGPAHRHGRVAVVHRELELLEP